MPIIFNSSRRLYCLNLLFHLTMNDISYRAGKRKALPDEKSG